MLLNGLKKSGSFIILVIISILGLEILGLKINETLNPKP
jgi:hypothetical protein